MNDTDNSGTELPCVDARYCSSCGEELPFQAVQFYADDLLNRYRASFQCPSCDYRGEVIRDGGLEDLSLNLVTDDGNPLRSRDAGSERDCPDCDGDLTVGGWCDSCSYGWRLNRSVDTDS